MEDAEIVALQNSLDEAQKQLNDLTAERDSLLEELAQVKDQNDSLIAENAETKKLNFTLARQLARGKRGVDRGAGCRAVRSAGNKET